MSTDCGFDPTPYSWTGWFGRLVKGSREERGLSISQAAERAGMDAARWQQIEGGKEATGAERKLLARGLSITDPAGMVPLVILARGIAL